MRRLASVGRGWPVPISIVLGHTEGRSRTSGCEGGLEADEVVDVERGAVVAVGGRVRRGKEGLEADEVVDVENGGLGGPVAVGVAGRSLDGEAPSRAAAGLAVAGGEGGGAVGRGDFAVEGDGRRGGDDAVADG